MNNMKKLLAVLLVLVMVVGLMAGCNGNDDTDTTTAGNVENPVDDTTAGGSTTTEGPQYGGHLNVHVYTKTTGLDPSKQTGIWKYPWTTLVYENVLTRDAENNICPGVCDYEVAEDWLSIKLWVREGATFSDGSAVEIEDVEASINRAISGMSTNCTKFVGGYIDTMAIDGDVLTITFKQYHEKTWYYLAAYQTWMGVMPKEICEKYAEAPILDAMEDAIGTGPYKVVDFEDGVQVTVARRAGYVPVDGDYTGMAAPKMAYLDSLTFWYNGDNASATMALLGGEYDITDVIDAEYMDMATADGFVKSTYKSSAGVSMIFNTMGNSVCSKYPDLRKAIMAAIDYEEYLGMVTDGAWDPDGELVLSPAYKSTEKWKAADYYGAANQEVVDKYLAAAKAAGYNDEPVEIVYNNAGHSEIPALLKGYMDAAGINYNVTIMESSVYSETIGDPGNKWDFYFVWPTYTFTPMTMPVSFMVNNYKGERKDALMLEMEAMVEGSDEYIAKWDELVDVMIDDCASVHMGTIYWYWYHQPELHTNDEASYVRYFQNTYWDNPEEHPSEYEFAPAV